MRELLLLLCQYPFREENREHLRNQLTQVQDWPKLVKLINAHGIIALAAYNIKEAGLEKEIPKDSMAILENGYMKSVMRNTWLTERWKEVNTILNNAGIQHILLKGMALEHTLYDSKGLRQMSDNDILIKHEDSVKAWQILQKEGFTPEPLKSPLFRKIMFDFGHHLPALYKDGYAVEIHDNIINQEVKTERNNYDTFSDAVEITISGTHALMLNKDTHLRYLINHFEHHAASGDCQLRLYNDIMLLDKTNALIFPDRFISDPMQAKKKEFRKAAYKTRIHSIAPKHRLRFILGDTFPSLTWMKERYSCGRVKAVLLYPMRAVKLGWLIP